MGTEWVRGAGGCWEARDAVAGDDSYALVVAETARANAEAERDRYHELWVQACAERDQLDVQIDRLANFIMQHVPGEPSQSQGAVDTAIRLLGRATRLAALEAAARALIEMTGPHPDEFTIQLWLDEVHALGDAVAALDDGPTGEPS